MKRLFTIALSLLAALGPAVHAADPKPPDQESPDVLFKEGLSHFQNRNFGKAEEIFTQALKLRPDHIPTVYMRGASRLSSGAFEGALEDFEAVVKAAPKYAKGLAMRGRTKLCLERYGEARGDLEAALALQPGEPGWKSDLDQSIMLERGNLEYGPGSLFPAIDLLPPAKKGEEPTLVREGWLLSLASTADKAERVLAGEKPNLGVLLVFFQSMDVPEERSWLSTLAEFHSEVREAGFAVAAISPDPPEQIFELQEGKELSFPLFSDPEGRAAWKLGILNVRRRERGEPLPTVLALDSKGRILLRRTVLDPKRRDPVEKILKDLSETRKK